VLLSGSRQEAGPGLPGHPPHGMRSSMVIGLVSCVWKLTEQRTITLATPYILTSNATLDTAMRDTEVPDLIKVANSIVGAGPAASSLEVIGNSNSNNNNDAWDTNSSGSRSSISRNLGSNGIIYLSTVIMEGTKYYLLLLLCYEIMIMAQQIIVEFWTKKQGGKKSNAIMIPLLKSNELTILCWPWVLVGTMRSIGKRIDKRSVCHDP
jgi:hypothetical protein